MNDRLEAFRIASFELGGLFRRFVLKTAIWSQAALRVEGAQYLEDLPHRAIFVSNHPSKIDAALILAALPRQAGAVVVISSAARAAARGRLEQRLYCGRSLLLFPEQIRNEDSVLGPFHPGAARLALERGAPVVPVAVLGSYAAVPPWRRTAAAFRRPVVVRYGRPVYPHGNEQPEELNARVLRSVSTLMAEEQLGWYESLRAGSIRAAGNTDSKDAHAGNWRRIWEATRPLNARTHKQVWR